MDAGTKFDEYSPDTGIKYGKEIIGKAWDISIESVLLVALSDKRNLPKLGFKSEPIDFKAYIGKWVVSYQKGYEGRPSVKTGKPSGTSPDVVIGYLLKAKLPNLSQDTVNQVVQGHSLLMSIENLVGSLLEEYLSVRLAEDGWFCCWGNTLDAIDFCQADGTLLQVKTSDNSENSSSSRVRSSTTIKKWQRRNSKKPDTYYWNELNSMVGRTDLSEEDFRAFAMDVIKQNPNCFHIADDHILRI